MAQFVSLRNPRTGEVKDVKVGWSWVLFFFAGFLGLPLFLRQLPVWGAFFLALSIINIATSYIPVAMNSAEDLGRGVGESLLNLGLSIWIGRKGNEMTAKNYLDRGWVFVNPDSLTTQVARQRWGLTSV
jgi:hypothetical protein